MTIPDESEYPTSPEMAAMQYTDPTTNSSHESHGRSDRLVLRA